MESKCLNNEVTLEELDKNLRQTTKMASDNEQKLDELSRKLGVQEDELKRAIERAELAENKLKSIEEVFFLLSSFLLWYFDTFVAFMLSYSHALTTL